MAIVDSKRQAYKGKINLSFNYNNQSINIQSDKIIYLMIENDYINNVLPIIYVSMSVNSDLYTKIAKYKESAKFYLNITKQNVFSSSSISKKVLSGAFSYIVSNTNPNYMEELNKSDARLDNSYKKIMVGLISIELTNILRKSFNGVYNNIDQNTLVGLALQGTNTVLEPLAYNKMYKSIMIPPLSSRYQMLKYIFDDEAFYDTNFRYFIDFDRSYLLSKVGDYVDANDGQLDSIIFDIKSVTAEESYYEGIEIKNGSHYIYINPANSNVVLNLGSEKVANQIIAVDDDSDLQTLNLQINNTIDSETKQLFIRADNAALYKNELETNTVAIDILKQNIDGSVLTPNKCINIKNYGDYKKYDGKYLMTHKKEFYKCIAGEFIISTIVGLKKVGNIETYRSPDNTSNMNNNAISKTARRTSTANLKPYIKR